MHVRRSPKTVSWVMAAFVLSSFIVQAASHFAVNAGHYASIGFPRPEPIMAFGIATMILQGALLGILYPTFHRVESPLKSALGFSWLMGLFLGSDFALVEPSKYAAPPVLEWIAVEGAATAIQFTLFGLLLALIYRSPSLAGGNR